VSDASNNQTLELMRRHRSIRSFTDKPVDADLIRRSVEAAQMAATSSHIQAYCVIRVTDPTVRTALVELTGGQSYVASAGSFFVVCGDVRRHQLIAARRGTPNVQNLETFLLAVVDASLFAQNLTLAFESEGLGICYIGGLRNRLPEVDRLLRLPGGVFPVFGLCVGNPADDPEVKPRLPVNAVLFEDAYPDDASLHESIDAYDETMSAYYAQRGLDGRNWSVGIARRFTKAIRTDLAEYYRGKGARID
jgi:nitroreductase